MHQTMVPTFPFCFLHVALKGVLYLQHQLLALHLFLHVGQWWCSDDYGLLLLCLCLPCGSVQVRQCYGSYTAIVVVSFSDHKIIVFYFFLCWRKSLNAFVTDVAATAFTGVTCYLSSLRSLPKLWVCPGVTYWGSTCKFSAKAWSSAL